MEILVSFAVIYMFSLMIVVLLFGFSACQEIRDEEKRVEEIKCRIKSIDDFYARANKANYERNRYAIINARQNGEFLEIINPLLGQIQVKIKDIFRDTCFAKYDDIQFIVYKQWEYLAVFKGNNKIIKVDGSLIMNIYYKQEEK